MTVKGYLSRQAFRTERKKKSYFSLSFSLYARPNQAAMDAFLIMEQSVWMYLSRSMSNLRLWMLFF